jgi:hypothetical protein
MGDGGEEVQQSGLEERLIGPDHIESEVVINANRKELKSPKENQRALRYGG